MDSLWGMGLGYRLLSGGMNKLIVRKPIEPPHGENVRTPFPQRESRLGEYANQICLLKKIIIMV